MNVTRRALRVSAIASLLGLISRIRARAASAPGDALTIDAMGNVSIQNRLTVLDAIDVKLGGRTYEPDDTKSLALYVTTNTDDGGKGIAEFRHSSGSQGIGLGYNTIYATGATTDQPLILRAKGTDAVRLQSAIDVRLGGRTDEAKLVEMTNEPYHPKGLALYVTTNTGDGGKGIAEFRHSNGSQGIGLGYNTIYATGATPDQPLILKAKGTDAVRLQSAVDVKLGERTDEAKLAEKTNEPYHPKGLALYVTAKTDDGGKGIAEFRHSNGSQGIGFGYNTIYTTGPVPDQSLILKARGTGSVVIGAQSATQVDLHVSGGVEPLRMLRGVVNQDGTKYAGEGFTVTRFKEGLYDVVFAPGFPSVPGASVTQVFGGISPGNAPATSEGSGWTTDNAVIAHLSADRMRVKTGQSGGYAADRFFSFIVIGPR
jgi:hypothetical protein